jgi:hypothetical protein
MFLPEAFQGKQCLLINQFGQSLPVLDTSSNFLDVTYLPKGLYRIVAENQIHISFVKY